MMWHLENMIGPSNFQSGIREYLSAYSFSNATWEDLVSILDKTTGDDLEEWSQVWVNTPGRPHFSVSQISGGSEIRQEDPLRQGRVWMQSFTNASKVNGIWVSETVNSDGEALFFKPIMIHFCLMQMALVTVCSQFRLGYLMIGKLWINKARQPADLRL